MFVLIMHCTLKINNCSAQWVQSSLNNQIVWSFTSNGNYIFAGTDANGVYISTNNGLNWVQSSLNNIEAFGLIVNNSNIFAATGRIGNQDSNGVYISSNNGQTWAHKNFNNSAVVSLAICGGNIFASNWGIGIYKSTNNGQSWTIALNGHNIFPMASSSTNIYAGSDSAVFTSTNSGQNWTQTLSNVSSNCFTISGNYIFLGVGGHMYISTNNGQNWSILNNIGGTWALASSGANIFAGYDDGTFYVSSNYGQTWTQRNEGMPAGIGIRSLFIYNGFLFAGRDSLGIWRRPLNEIIGIKQISSEVPSVYSLNQNYPNPFNPSTNIKYELPKNSFVKIVVFDMLGREVEALVNEKLSPGSYSIDWNASQYPSGVYFYRLTTEGFSETKKMILLK